RVARPGRAPRRLGGLQDGRRPAPRGPAPAPRPAPPGRQGAGLRLVLRAPGGRLRPDGPRDGRADRRLPRRGPAPLRAVAYLGPAQPGGPTRRRGPRRTDPRPLAAEPLGPELARTRRRGRPRPAFE